MPPEQDPNLPHPLETGIESLIIQNEDIKSTLEESNLLLQSIALDSNNNDLERSLELQMLQSEENHKETLVALKELQPALSEAISNIPKPDTPDFSETNSLLSTMIEEIKKKEDIEIEIDEETRGRLRGEKGDKGERGERGPKGERGERGRDGIDGLDGKDGKNGSPDTPKDIKKKLESLEGDDRLDAKAIKGLDKLEKKVKGIERIQDNYVFGSGETDTLQTVTDRGATTTNTINVPAIQHQNSYTPTGNEPTGTTYWDSDNHSLSTVYENGAILQHGFELYTFGTDEGNDFPEGSAVSVKGASGNRVAFELTDINDSESANNYIGLLTTPVDSGNRLATREGPVRNINTTGTPQGEVWAEGDFIYVGSTPGSLTNVEPTTGRVIRVGTVTNRHQTQGVIELDRLIIPETAPTKITVTTDTTLTFTRGNYLILIDTALGNINITLPTAVNNTTQYLFKRISSGAYTARILPNGTETIDTYTYLDILFKNTNMPLVSDGTNWLIL